MEGVVETLASSGVATSKLREALREPVKNFANDAQLRELIAFLLAVDPTLAPHAIWTVLNLKAEKQ